MKSNQLLKILIAENIEYALIEGVYDIDSLEIERKPFNADIDIFISSNSIYIIDLLKNKKEFHYLEGHSFIEIKSKTRIDLYFNSLNVGYYHFLIIDSNCFVNQKISESEYIVYQILDPLLKFSRYQLRHQFRLDQYFSSPVSNDVKDLLDLAVGKLLSYLLLNKIRNNDFEVSKIFIKCCKLRLLFINGNFVKMLKSRLF